MSSVRQGFSRSENERSENDMQEEREPFLPHGKPYRTSSPDDSAPQEKSRADSARVTMRSRTREACSTGQRAVGTLHSRESMWVRPSQRSSFLSA